MARPPAALAVPCPQCAALPGQWCARARRVVGGPGYVVERIRPHPARRALHAKVAA